ncbi:hypothetical protein WR25_13931 [Diploscapter pachys]|uniref:Uncharacterized protein n=1 Tax=Diploscapter pachys TaxID=2018661 RepID=A0A2A2KCC9_9BILA|nr:hypothetical protein WR25_13931 [Diploscapter pachys]
MLAVLALAGRPADQRATLLLPLLVALGAGCLGFFPSAALLLPSLVYLLRPVPARRAEVALLAFIVGAGVAPQLFREGLQNPQAWGPTPGPVPPRPLPESGLPTRAMIAPGIARYPLTHCTTRPTGHPPSTHNARHSWPPATGPGTPAGHRVATYETSGSPTAVMETLHDPPAQC